MRENQSASVVELSKIFFTSQTSIRRDLIKLENSGYIHKFYGGASLSQSHNEVLALETREKLERTEKHVIAQKAVSLIENGDIIFIDSSSTALSMTPYLGKFTNLQVITHGLKIAMSLTEYPQIRVYFAGGLITPNIFSCNGTMTCRMLSNLRADKAFISPRAIDMKYGVYCASEEESVVRSTMIEQSKKIILLCNNNKLGRNAFFHLCKLNDVDTIVCENTPDKLWLDCFAENGVDCL